MCAEVDEAIEAGAEFIVLSDRDSNKDLAPIPSLLMLAAVHHHLIRTETRMKVGLVVEAGDVREVHHVATLIGYGASAINPYLAMETVEHLVRAGSSPGVTPEKAVKNLINALGKGVLKIMSKMGISTVSSYAGAQVVRGRRPVARSFVDDVLHRHRDQARRRRHRRHRRRERRTPRVRLPGGRRGRARTSACGPAASTSGAATARRTSSTPTRCSGCSTRRATRRYDIFREYTQLVDDQAAELMTLRGLFKLEHGRAHARAARRGRVGRRRSSSASPPAR